MSKLAIVILSDVHFERTNPLVSRASAIASAVSSVSVGCDKILLLLAGDLVWSGDRAEFEIATAFLTSLVQRLRDRHVVADITILAVPGNHDCVLPAEAASNRRAKVERAARSLANETPDHYSIDDVLAAQSNYWEFASTETSSPASSIEDRLCSSLIFPHADKQVSVTLLNTALLSQHKEIKGGLLAPIAILRRKLATASKANLSIVILHHWGGWIDPNNMMALRQILLGSADIVIAGHQHFNSAYTHEDTDGYNLIVRESPALFDREHPTSSVFRVILYDPQLTSITDHLFRWKQDLYRPYKNIDEVTPQLVIRGNAAQSPFLLKSEFISELNDPGVAYIHASRDKMALSELFVYPDLKSKPLDAGGSADLVRGNAALGSIADLGIQLIKGGALSGKTALAKQMFLDLNAQRGKICVLLRGSQIDDIRADQLGRELRTRLSTQYQDPDIDEYFQTDPQRRCVIVDDWHKARLTEEQRLSWYEWLRQFAGTAVLFTDEIFDIKTIAASGTATQFDVSQKLRQFSITGLSNRSRGLLIANWIRLRLDTRRNPPESSRDAKVMEDLITERLTRDSLPPYGFFVLCLLQADENKSLDSTSGSSFGHLYEVLVTTALNKGREPDPSLSKKFALLQEIAYRLWSTGAEVISRVQIEDVAETYSGKYLVRLPTDRLLADLVDTRVLSNSEDSYRFAYEHFYLYFVARYIRDHIDDPFSDDIKEKVEAILDTISFSRHSTIVMFLIYFASGRRHLVERLVRNASLIYEGVPMAKLEEDTRSFMHSNSLLSAPVIEEDPDIAKNRDEERSRKDEAALSAGADRSLDREAFTYSEDITDLRKLHLAETH